MNIFLNLLSVLDVFLHMLECPNSVHTRVRACYMLASGMSISRTNRLNMEKSFRRLLFVS